MKKLSLVFAMILVFTSVFSICANAESETKTEKFFADIEKLEQCGYLDENTFLYYEENILGFRLKERGYINYLFYQKTYDHLHSVSINKSFSSAQKRLEISQKSRKYYCDKYLRINKLQKALLDVSFVIGIMNYKVACWLLRK